MPLWKWNEIDTTQFTRVIGSATLTFQTSSFAGEGLNKPVLYFSASAPGLSVWVVNDFSTMPSRSLFTGRIFVSGATGASNRGAGLVYRYDATNRFFMSLVDAGGTVRNHWQNDQRLLLASATPSTLGGNDSEMGGSLALTILSHLDVDANNSSLFVYTEDMFSDAIQVATDEDFGNGNFSSSWGHANPIGNQIGIAFSASSTLTTGWVMDLALFKYVMDYDVE